MTHNVKNKKILKYYLRVETMNRHFVLALTGRCSLTDEGDQIVLYCGKGIKVIHNENVAFTWLAGDVL